MFSFFQSLVPYFNQDTTPDKITAGLSAMAFEGAEGAVLALRSDAHDRLGQGRWFNDEIINHWFSLLNKRFTAVTTVGSFMIPSLQVGHGKERGARTREQFEKIVNDSASEIILLPFNHKKHWQLFIYEKSTQCLYHMDTLNYQADSNATECLKTNLKSALKIDGNISFEKIQLPVQSTKDGDILQPNEFDCGPGVCFVALLAASEKIAAIRSFSQFHVKGYDYSVMRGNISQYFKRLQPVNFIDLTSHDRGNDDVTFIRSVDRQPSESRASKRRHKEIGSCTTGTSIKNPTKKMKSKK